MIDNVDNRSHEAFNMQKENHLIVSMLITNLLISDIR